MVPGLAPHVFDKEFTLQEPLTSPGASRTLRMLLAAAAGCLIANLYYPQPLVASIAHDLGLGSELAGGIVSLIQVGYGCGMVLVVPLSDLVENRRLVLGAMAGVVLALGLLVTAHSAVPFVVAAILLGLCCAAAQVIIPFVAHLVEGPGQGQAVAATMAVVLTAITLARPVALLIADFAGWRAVFIASGAMVVAIGALLVRYMPRRDPRSAIGFVGNLRSLAGLFQSEPELRRRALYQGCMFAAFNAYWVTVPMVLATRFSMSKPGIAAFALVGAIGAFAASFAARLAARGYMRSGTVIACFSFAAALAVSNLAVNWHWLIVFGMLALVVDAAFHTSQTFGRLVALNVDPALRGRANSLYMTIMFIGGAIGSLIGGASFERGGWPAASAVGMVLALGVALFSLADRGRTVTNP